MSPLARPDRFSISAPPLHQPLFWWIPPAVAWRDKTSWDGVDDNHWASTFHGFVGTWIKDSATSVWRQREPPLSYTCCSLLQSMPARERLVVPKTIDDVDLCVCLLVHYRGTRPTMSQQLTFALFNTLLYTSLRCLSEIERFSLSNVRETLKRLIAVSCLSSLVQC